MSVVITQDLHCYVGDDYSDTFQFWADEAGTQPFDFTNWTAFTMKIGTAALTGAAITVLANQGQLTPFLARSTTVTYVPSTVPYSITALDPSGHRGHLMVGNFVWKDPQA